MEKSCPSGRVTRSSILTSRIPLLLILLAVFVSTEGHVFRDKYLDDESQESTIPSQFAYYSSPPSHFSGDFEPRVGKPYHHRRVRNPKDRVVIISGGGGSGGGENLGESDLVWVGEWEQGFTHYNVGVLLVSGTGSSFDLEKCAPAVDMALETVNEVYLRPHKIRLNKVQNR